jgi:hypothetical protein
MEKRMSKELPPDTFVDEACLPIEPLLKLWQNDREHLGLEHVAEVCGVGRRSFIRWKESGVPIRFAERIADELKIHPTSIWGSAYHIAAYYEYQRWLERKRTTKARSLARAKALKES